MEQILCSLMFVLAGAVGQTVIYPFTSTCAVKGSTVTLPCTFTPRQSLMKDGNVSPLHVVRVVWCQNHLICQGSTPSVYDSESQINNPRYKYLGDKQGNCTLQIRDVQQDDNATFRFRMEANNSAGHFTNQTGVTVTVIDDTKMRTNSSSGEKNMKIGETVSLQCTTNCTFHQLEVTWFKDGHTLPVYGPILPIGPLVAQHSGNYTCTLRSAMETVSVPYSLQVAPDEEGGSKLTMMVAVAFGALLAAVTLILIVFIIKRKHTARNRRDEEQKQHGELYSNIKLSADPQGRKTGGAVEDVSYASVQFKQQNYGSRCVKEPVDVIYSSVVS